MTIPRPAIPRPAIPRPAQPRIPPRPESTWDDEARAQIARGMVGMGDGEPMHIFTTLAHHPKLLKYWLVFAGGILSKGRLPGRDRELLILRTGWHCRAEYEWGHHVEIGHRVGLTDEEIQRITDGPDAAGWSEFDRVLLRAADELHDDACISDATWNALAARYDTEQLLEVPMTVGQYHLVSMTLNSVGIQREPGVVGLPNPTPAQP